MSLIQKYANWKRKSVERDYLDLKESSDWRVFNQTILMVILDIIMWGIIAFFVYIWWQTKMSGCPDIEMCKNCYNQVQDYFINNASGLIKIPQMIVTGKQKRL